MFSPFSWHMLAYQIIVCCRYIAGYISNNKLKRILRLFCCIFSSAIFFSSFSKLFCLSGLIFFDLQSISDTFVLLVGANMVHLVWLSGWACSESRISLCRVQEADILSQIQLRIPACQMGIFLSTTLNPTIENNCLIKLQKPPDLRKYKY